MSADLHTRVETTDLDAGQVAARARLIYDTVLKESPYVDRGDFTQINTSDLPRLFEEYDRRFFDRQIVATLGDAPLRFRLSTRMTRAGGRTARYTSRNRPGNSRYEISVATTLLYQCFTGDDHRPITVAGITCNDRLEALQRIMEHELIHLVEMLLWTKTSCSAGRFQSIASRFFAHRGSTHELVTPSERALVRFGIRPGVRVRFRHDDVDYIGIVNRVTKRATVLVEDPCGVPFSDGNRYSTFYVPVEMLETVETGQP